MPVLPSTRRSVLPMPTKLRCVGGFVRYCFLINSYTTETRLLKTLRVHVDPFDYVCDIILFFSLMLDLSGHMTYWSPFICVVVPLTSFCPHWYHSLCWSSRIIACNMNSTINPAPPTEHRTFVLKLFCVLLTFCLYIFVELANWTASSNLLCTNLTL